MNLRDEVEALLRGWDKHERDRGRQQIIDYDCFPEGPPAAPVVNRIEVYEQLLDLRDRAHDANEPWILARVEADLAYVSAKLGERTDLATYVQATQGCGTTGWSAEYLQRRKGEAVEALAGIGIGWSASTNKELEDSEGRLTPEETADEIRSQATELEDRVRKLAGTEAPFSLSVEEVNIDDYWSYWLDGAGKDARLRINLRNAQFTKIRARQLALHEILGHALQAASYYEQASKRDVPWVRILSVHAPQQVLLEGLAQALPYFVTPDEADLMARSRLTHYLQLVRAELHLKINAGVSVGECVDFATSEVPFWSGESIADTLDDRANNTLLRSYLWSYPTGMDWFVRLAEDASEAAPDVFRACYEAPLKPGDLAARWSDGPLFGGSR